VKWLLVGCLATSGLACGARPAPKSSQPALISKAPHSDERWLTQLDRGHALAGRVWDVRARAFAAPNALVQRLAQARFVLLGERHDNPDHHRLQARMLDAMVQAGRRPTLVLEMLEIERQATVDEYLARAPATAGGLGAALQWQETSWPPFSEYQPIFEVALAARLTIAAGNLAHESARALVKNGLSALPEERVKALRLDQPFPEQSQAALVAELRASHCGHLPEHLIAPMALAQHARDSQMASVMLSRGKSDGAVLIAGAGHARRDRGVPYYLGLEQPEATVLSVALQEVERALLDPEAYEVAAFDYVWFTPRGSDEDPCAAFGKPKK
jgi:uncharacterized iron-regulated protein